MTKREIAIDTGLLRKLYDEASDVRSSAEVHESMRLARLGTLEARLALFRATLIGVQAARHCGGDRTLERGSGTMSFNLICCTDVILNEVAQGRTQKEIALTYAMAIKSAAQKADSPDWAKINGAILSRWKMSGLERIKKRAIDIASGKVQP